VRSFYLTTFEFLKALFCARMSFLFIHNNQGVLFAF
jgi:hypothetical protein